MGKETFAYTFDPAKSQYYDEIMLSLKKYNDGEITLEDLNKFSYTDIQEAKNYSYKNMRNKYSLDVNLDDY